MAVRRSNLVSTTSAVVLAAAACGCGSKTGPTPDKDPAAAPSGTATAAMRDAPPTASATAAPAPKIPFFVKADVKVPAGAGPLFPIDGALMTASGRKVGRVAGDKIEWVGEVPAGHVAFGPTRVTDVVGRWPDAVGAYYSNENGRAPEPTYTAITGKSRSKTFAEGGGSGTIVAVVEIGKSTVVVGDAHMTGSDIVTVNGPLLPHRGRTAKEYGCTKEEIIRVVGDAGFAVVPSAALVTEGGSLVTAGALCESRGSAAEVWTPDGLKSSVIDLSKLIGDAAYGTTMAGGPGEEVWIARSYSKDLVRLRGKTPEAIAAPEGDSIRAVLASKKREVHLMTDRGFYRRSGDSWEQIARRPWRQGYSVAKLDDDGNLWVRDYGGWDKLGPGEDPTEWRDDCPTPFVYLYDVSSSNSPTFDFPTTRKALSSFPEASGLSLLDFKLQGARMLGLQVASKAQGEAVIAHVLATMKGEHPRLVCLAPESPRKVELSGKK